VRCARQKPKQQQQYLSYFGVLITMISPVTSCSLHAIRDPPVLINSTFFRSASCIVLHELGLYSGSCHLCMGTQDCPSHSSLSQSFWIPVAGCACDTLLKRSSPLASWTVTGVFRCRILLLLDNVVLDVSLFIDDELGSIVSERHSIRTTTMSETSKPRDANRRFSRARM
jgi:hypothetical protein